MEFPINIINLPNRTAAPRILNSLPRTRVSTVNIKPSLPLHDVSIMTNLEHLMIILGFIITQTQYKICVRMFQLGNFLDFQTDGFHQKISLSTTTQINPLQAKSRTDQT